MDEARIFLVDLHQLLIGFVLHGWLRICSHGNQVGHTLTNRTCYGSALQTRDDCGQVSFSQC